MTTGAVLTEHEFSQFSKFIYERAGIHLPPSKLALVSGRLAKRVKHYQFDSYGDYFRLVMREGGAELQLMVDLLTTNETYFFREPKHFDYLRDHILPEHRAGRAFRIWSAASSSGEESYSLAMVLADVLGDGLWEVLGSDISARVLEKARRGHYSLDRTEGLPPRYLSRFCLKGVGSYEGTLLVDRSIRSRVQFLPVNLVEPLPKLGEFDVIFLRNVMIYFDLDTKRHVVAHLLPLLRSGGYFFISHSETLHGINDTLRIVAPSVYRKP
ncbi:SAM-dependent methyltransferase [Candidatus Methylospira mobilis]|uniref:Chemotaxis protein methyltransferase n=1 Tax=Candidatus Methylospira mobilis TaxID=1808979 RepID=A0A5Q0BGW2_9GAMM|nr:CheR family methyltransferase [Candidatus Methylospira mobilis]QFY42372.1 SAM-dependent methyltransferase [Candidatus Methylospira mobilis]WNV04530.1 CheR family methyltransferase [Candidatus Methylospira mobilis]